MNPLFTIHRVQLPGFLVGRFERKETKEYTRSMRWLSFGPGAEISVEIMWSSICQLSDASFCVCVCLMLVRALL